jgi:putative adenylate-forming enzyme
VTTLLRIGGHFARAQWAFTHLRGDGLRAYQERRALRLVSFAVGYSPFYLRHWVGQDLTDWRNLTTVDKATMMKNFDSFNTRGISKDEAMNVALAAERSRDFAPTLSGLTVGLSSGTSGHRGLFLVSPRETAAWAGTILARTLHRLPPPGYRIAFFLRSNSNLYERVNASRRVRFRWFDLMTPLTEAVAGLNEYRPDMLVGPPSLLRMLAGERAEGKLNIEPERLLSVAEVLEPQDREYIESVFGVLVHQVYQCTEGLLAATCPAGRLHVQEDLVALQYEPVAPHDGCRVTPIVTDLWRDVQPILRYRLGDVLHLDPSPCTCGSAFQVIGQIEGRCDDLCFFITADGVPRVFFPDMIRRMILLAHSGITDYAVEQEGPGHLRVFVDVGRRKNTDEVIAAVRENIAGAVAEYDCRPATIQVEVGVPAFPPDAKKRRVRNLAGATRGDGA